MKTASIIIQDQKNRVLLLLRDNNPNIIYPNHWNIIGGYVEKGETAEEALKREIKEEISYEVEDFNFFAKYPSSRFNKEHHIFSTKGNFDLHDFTLGEGQKLAFFSQQEITKIKIMPLVKKILNDYFTQKP